VGSILVLGFLVGVRHALEADHLAAIASLSAGGPGSWRAGLLRGGAWGCGHALTLLAIGAVCLAAGAIIPPAISGGLEAFVGVMLLVLGLDVLRRLRRERVRFHPHRHRNDVVHVHAHRCDDAVASTGDAHRHAHAMRTPVRAVLVGTVHGLAGSGPLVLLALQTAPSAWAGIGYITLFGIGSVAGMAALSLAISWPLQLSAGRFARATAGLEAAVGALTVALGLWILYETLLTTGGPGV
jgi:cytochrome c biogenesis protein CcdA